MELKNNLSNKLWSLFLILCITRVCHGQLMCYVCDNCAVINDNTPLMECNEDYFNTGGTTDSSVQTTDIPSVTDEGSSTTDSTITTTTEEPTSSTDEPSTTTDDATHEPSTESEPTTETTTETTPEITTEEITTDSSNSTTDENGGGSPSSPTTTSTTEPQPPTPPTVGPPSTTTSIPTPPNPDVFQPIDDVEKLNNSSQMEHDDEVDGLEIEHISTTKAYKPSAEFRVRQLRSISDVTYHCFKVLATNENNTVIVNRGCSRVTTMESVCDQWVELNPTLTKDKCFPCSRSQCNGSTTLNVSITVLIVALVAVFMHRK